MTSPFSGAPKGAAPSIGFLSHRIGDRIKDRYDVLERLGGGNFGSVYRVLDSAVGNTIACKEMHVLDNPATATDERSLALDLFKREALNLATLRHPHIPAAYFDQEEGDWRVCPICGLDYSGSNPNLIARCCPEHGSDLLPIQTRFYLMMDFVDGPTLEELAARQMKEKGQPLEEEQVLEWAYEIALATRTLHRVGIIHRDIKPENIKIRRSDNAAILLDFGLTKKVEEAGGYGTAPLTGTARFGTAGYAPENPQERERPEKRSDIHALGMTIYRLVSGRDPQDPFQLRELRGNTPRFFNSALSPELEQLIKTATAPDMTSRFQSIDELLADLESIRAPGQGTHQIPPFTFADGAKARGQSDLARLLDSHSSESIVYLFNGMFGSWLLQNGFAAPARAIEQIVKVHAKNPEMALELFRRSLFPTGTSNIFPKVEASPAILNLGSLPSGAVAETKIVLRNTGPGLAWGLLRVPARRGAQSGLSLAVKSILSGTSMSDDSALPGLQFPAQFQGNEVEIGLFLDTNRVPTGSYSSHLIIETDGGEARVPISYTVVPLELRATPESLDFGAVEVGKRRTLSLQVTPTDERGGQPRGTIYIGPSLLGLSAPERFEGTQPLSIVVDASSPSVVARPYDGLLQLDTNGGRIRIPVRYQVTLPALALAGIVGLSTLWGAVGMAILRLLYGLINPDYTTRWLVRDLQSGAGVGLEGFHFKGLGPLLAGAALGSYACLLYAKRLRKIPARERPGPFKHSDETVLNSLPMFGLVFGTFAGYLAAQLLHWTLWSVGDWLLFPLGRDLASLAGKAIYAQNLAPIVWASAGSVGGIFWGISKILNARKQGAGRIFFAAFLAVAILGLLLYAVIAPGR